ncbi:hypothetical protein CDD81_1717 [Ophiocordyceps australis]|uniref:Uncharacterized protein n=1 Tax=Ophiocordyceps australis TaxID=1399860 RepID=A0A2C5YFI4_9HYPO|nr:hypothetical protein CDD81_1717 [Ophiocordyceps australis]
MELTVGIVSGLIAAGIFLARQICPNALAYICSRQLGYRNSAATWTASSKVMEQSYWPFLLRTDGVYDKHVRSSVVWAGRLIPLMGVLLSVASIVTPLGLYSATELGKPIMATFVYAPDPSVFGRYTMPRPPKGNLKRFCLKKLPQDGTNATEIRDYSCPLENASDPEGPGILAEVLRQSIPLDIVEDSEWQEDLLFIEPETVCVDTNISALWSKKLGIEYRVDDRGRLARMEKTRPKPDLREAHRDPKLLQRAQAAAWMHNAMYAYVFNLTEPPGQNDSMFESISVPLNSSNITSGFLEVSGNRRDDSSENIFDSLEHSYQELLNHPFFINKICQGTDQSFNKSTYTPFVICGLLHGMVQEYSDDFLAKPYYSCASTVKAVIKTVEFSYKDDKVPLRGLKVMSIRDKKYPNEASLPIWGVETPGPEYSPTDISPLWGLISPDHGTAPGIKTYRQPHLYLPGRMKDYSPHTPQFLSEQGLLAGFDIVPRALYFTYCVGRPGNETFDAPYCDFFDYHPSFNMALAEKWKTLTASAKEASNIPNLVFQDTVVNLLAGTKGIGLLNTDNRQLVRPLVTVIKLKYAYVVPAAMAATGTLMIILIALASIFYKNENSLAAMKTHVQRLAPGRIFTTLLAPEDQEGSDLKTSSKSWNKKFGAWKVDISSEYPVVVDTCQECKGPRSSEGEEEQQGNNDMDQGDERQDCLLSERVA